MTEWKLQGSRVFGQGQSYNCINRVTAEQLYNTLTTYENTIQTNQRTDEILDNIDNQLNQLKINVQSLENEIINLQDRIK